MRGALWEEEEPEERKRPRMPGDSRYRPALRCCSCFGQVSVLESEHKPLSHKWTGKEQTGQEPPCPILTPAPCSHCSLYLHGSLSLPDLSPNPAYSRSMEPFAASSKKPPSPLPGISFPVRHADHSPLKERTPRISSVAPTAPSHLVLDA